MREFLERSTKNFRRFATVLATVVAGMVFVLVSSAIAAPDEKKIEIKKPEIVIKIDKIENADPKVLFNKEPLAKVRSSVFAPIFVRPHFPVPIFFRLHFPVPIFFNPAFDVDFEDFN